MVPDTEKTFTFEPARIGGAEALGTALSVVWLLVVFLIIMTLPAIPSDASDGQRRMVILMLTVVPLAIVWGAVAGMRGLRIVRQELAQARAETSALRQAYARDRVAKPESAPTVERKLDEIAQTARKTETALATFTSSREGQRPRLAITGVKPASQDDQPTLALGTRVEDSAPPLPRVDFIRALNFPDNDQDTTGFNALRRALKDRNARQLVQASQDVLTLLSQDGIYMDDLRPDRARPEIWRRFAQGERGGQMAVIGGIRDRSSLALTAGRMREDTIFRDAAHHFLRLFDRALVMFEAEASDEDLIALSETRSARAFMLLGRVTGAFD